MAGIRAATGLRAGAGAVAIGLAAGIVAVACEGTASPRTAGLAHGGGASRPAVTTTVITSAKSRPYHLYTHCGVSEARIDGQYYKATRPLSDGSGNRVVFDLRPGASAFLTVCS